MNVTDSIGAAVSTLAAKPASIVPFYLLGTSVTTVAQVVPLVGLLVAYLLLLAQGRIATVQSELRGLDLTTVQGDEVDPETLPAERIGEATAQLVTPEVVAILALSLVGFVAVAVVLGAVVLGGQTHVAYSALVGGRPLADGVGGLLADARTFVGLRLLQIGLYFLVTLLFALVASVPLVAASGGRTLAALFAVLLAPVWLLAMLAVAAAFVFAPQAIVVDDERVGGALRRSLGVLRHRPLAFGGYVLVAIGVGGTLGIVGGAFAVVGVPNVATLGGVLLATPLLHLVKTAIYVDEAAVVEPDAERPGAVERLRAASRDGLASMLRFAVGSPALLALSLGLFALGGVAGYRAMAGFEFVIAGPENAGDVFGTVPIDVFLNIATNNWLVSVAVSYGGLAFGVPTAANLLFNGVVVGAVSGIGYDPVVVAALIAPHGILEVPALAVAGALGFRLAAVGWRRARGRIDDVAVAEEIRLAYRVLVGLAFVFVVAAFVEAFVTPWVAAGVV